MAAPCPEGMHPMEHSATTIFVGTPVVASAPQDVAGAFVPATVLSRSLTKTPHGEEEDRAGPTA